MASMTVSGWCILLYFRVATTFTYTNCIVHIGWIWSSATVEIKWFDCSFRFSVVLQTSMWCCAQSKRIELNLNKILETQDECTEMIDVVGNRTCHWWVQRHSPGNNCWRVTCTFQLSHMNVPRYKTQSWIQSSIRYLQYQVIGLTSILTGHKNRNVNCKSKSKCKTESHQADG